VVPFETFAALGFWSGAALILYVYGGYPALLWVWARLRPAPIEADEPGAATGVTIVIAARDEASRLRARIDNILQLDHPASLRQIVVVSDGSTDNTAEVVGRFGDLVDFVSVPAIGKACALNAGVERARFDILVFTDARQLFAPDAIAELLAPLRDPEVGGVTGELILDCESSWRRQAERDRRRRARAAAADRREAGPSTIAAGVGAYWRYEKALRRLESLVGSTLGATGAIYAMRRSLWVPLPADTILDDVLTPMRAVLEGFRMVFNPRARAFDLTAPDARAEAGRKTRTMTGNYQILWLEPRLLLPWRNPVWLQYVSHKIGRLVVPGALLTVFASSLLLANRLFYLLALLAQCAFYLLAGYGAWLEHQARKQRVQAPAEPAVAMATHKEIVNA
jgi:cellulose synthase/poly-beta-1,6-N-acetylglucosamine synthase-like glycosyltransferase